MFVWIFIWLATLIYYTVAFNDTCRDIPCTCCSDGGCTLSADNQFFCRSCINGYTGRSCEEPCPENCLNCSQTFYTSERICFACQNGYYKGRNKDITEYPIQNDCSLSCTTGCESCTSYHSCNRCEIGYFSSSEKQCIKCLTNCAKCSNYTTCEQCKDRYFVENHYCRQCQQHCKTCISSQQCSVCELGYYLDGKGCKQCQKEGCLGCISLNTCSSCQKGYYLTNGQCLTCGSNCIDCTLNSQSQVICGGCQNGYYIHNGSCSNCGIGCNVCKSKTNCVICEHGYQLHNGVCLKCPLNCNLCESNNYCNACKVGYFVNKGQCNECHESCTSCSSMEQCLTCADGFYGSKCSYHCNENCYSNQCDKVTGICLSCRKGYYFKDNTQCVSCPEHCIVCKSPGTCMVCEDGYKGETCQDECSNCKKGTRCEKANGYCFEECREGLSGPNCDLTCDQKCSRCTRGNPNECQTCAHDRYGVSCTEQCSLNCFNSSCFGMNGSCRHGCESGYWGPICEHNCSSNCSVKMCDRISGYCLFQATEETNGTPSISAISIGLIVSAVIIITLLVAVLAVGFIRFNWRQKINGRISLWNKHRNEKLKMRNDEKNEDKPLLDSRNKNYAESEVKFASSTESQLSHQLIVEQDEKHPVFERGKKLHTGVTQCDKDIVIEQKNNSADIKHGDKLDNIDQGDKHNDDNKRKPSVFEKDVIDQEVKPNVDKTGYKNTVVNQGHEPTFLEQRNTFPVGEHKPAVDAQKKQPAIFEQEHKPVVGCSKEKKCAHAFGVHEINLADVDDHKEKPADDKQRYKPSVNKQGDRPAFVSKQDKRADVKQRYKPAVTEICNKSAIVKQVQRDKSADVKSEHEPTDVGQGVKPAADLKLEEKPADVFRLPIS